MICLNIECETVAELRTQLQLLLASVEAAAPAEDKPAPKKPAPKKAAEPAAEKTNGNGEAPAPDETDLRKRATKFAAKNGPGALIELQKNAGAPNGKISEIIGHENRMDKLGLLLAEASF